MPREIWEATAIRDHLLAVYTGQTAYLEVSLPDPSRAKAYKLGIDMVLRYLAHRFGIAKRKKGQTSELRTWSRDDIRHILVEVRAIIEQATNHDSPQTSNNQDYFAGINHTLNAVAISFGIPGIATG